jgi:hypothetical protein
LGTLVAGLIGAAVLLWRSIDIESVLEPANKDAPAVQAVLPELVLAAPTETTPWRAYLYESRHTDAFFPDQIYYEGLAARWDSLLSGVGASVTRLNGAAAIDSIPGRELLVVPSAVCMDSEERRAIRRHADQGGHLLVSWALGARNEKCEWIGYDFLQSLSGTEAAGTMEERSPTYLAVQHGSVTAAGLPPGAPRAAAPQVRRPQARIRQVAGSFGSAIGSTWGQVIATSDCSTSWRPMPRCGRLAISLPTSIPGRTAIGRQ